MSIDLNKEAARHASYYNTLYDSFTSLVVARAAENAVQEMTSQEYFDSLAKLVAELIPRNCSTPASKGDVLLILETLSKESALACNDKLKSGLTIDDWRPFNSSSRERVAKVSRAIKEVLFKKCEIDPTKSMESWSQALFLLTCLATLAAKTGSAPEFKEIDFSTQLSVSLKNQLE